MEETLTLHNVECQISFAGRLPEPEVDEGRRLHDRKRLTQLCSCWTKQSQFQAET